MEYYLYIHDDPFAPNRYTGKFKEFPALTLYGKGLTDLIENAQDTLREIEAEYEINMWELPERVDPKDGGILISTKTKDIQVFCDLDS